MAISLEKLLEDIRNPDEDMVVLALRTLKRVRGQSFANSPREASEIAAVLERLVEESSDEVRFFARECLEHVKEHLPAASDSGATEVDGEARAPRPEAPAARPGMDNRDKVVQFLAKGVMDPQKAVAALAALCPVMRGSELPLVRKYLRHRAPLVRTHAVKAIAAAGDERVIIEALLPYLNDPSQTVRDEVLSAIKAIDSQRLMTVLETMLRSTKISIKVAAVYIMAHLQGPEIIRLLGAAARDKHEEVRSKVVDALKGRRGKDVLVILKGLVNDMDIDVAEKALKIYEKLKFDEGILNSSTELGDVIMEKLREISMSDDVDDSAEHRLPFEIQVDPERRIPVGAQKAVLEEFVVPKKPAAARRGAAMSQQQSAAPGGEGRGEDGTGEGMPGEGMPGESSEEPAVFKRLSEYPEEIQRMSEEVYDKIDELLEEMGRTIWKLEKANRISNKRFSKLNYDIQRYEDMLAKRKEEFAKTGGGFFSKLSAGNRRLQEKQQLNLEFSLSELYRRLGEVAVELSLSEDSRFPELRIYYSKVNALLEDVRKIKEMYDL